MLTPACKERFEAFENCCTAGMQVCAESRVPMNLQLTDNFKCQFQLQLRSKLDEGLCPVGIEDWSCVWISSLVLLTLQHLEECSLGESITEGTRRDGLERRMGSRVASYSVLYCLRKAYDGTDFSCRSVPLPNLLVSAADSFIKWGSLLKFDHTLRNNQYPLGKVTKCSDKLHPELIRFLPH